MIEYEDGDGDEDYVRGIARSLCDESSLQKFALTALVAAVQERLDEDVILNPNKKRKSDIPTVYHQQLIHQGNILWRHHIYYRIPQNHSPRSLDLLDIALNIGHEIGHLALDWGPGRIGYRPGIPLQMVDTIREIEANWFGLCVLLMYGFLVRQTRASV